ncbi:hypothetical protein M9H77_05393 [Catharanthus roseus]|uniref:Uncharacterized protein n=1 Tax=Catharanthus roseus TaxID=4058 RepID=A0ACC0CGZ4_CATRO|nr:hypothetical protein M9H77_05393 [Catharanthus roseus]
MSTTISFAPIIFRIHHRPWHPPRTPARGLGHQRLRFTSGISSSFKDKRTLKLTSMAESARIRDGNGDGGITALEQEGLIDGSSNLGADGFEATLNSLSKWLVAAVLGVIVLWRHDAEALWAAGGSVINSVLSIILKKALNQERPVANLRSDPGMPSSHAQSISFAVVFAILSVVQWLGWNGSTAVLSGLFIALGSYFSWLRVSQKLHTISQVVVGALVGTIFSIIWFWSWDSFVVKAFTSYLWVRIVITLGGAVFCVGFLLYVLRYWVMETVILYMSRKS